MVNHSVVLVGWGITDDPEEVPDFWLTKNNNCPAKNDGAYWVIANSWGNAFGEEGFFRVRRGCDDFAIESQSLSINLLLSDDIIAPGYLSNRPDENTQSSC